MQKQNGIKKLFFGIPKSTKELLKIRPSIPSWTISELNKLGKSVTGYILVHQTALPNVFTLSDGTTVPVEAFKEITESTCYISNQDVSKDINKSCKGKLKNTYELSRSVPDISSDTLFTLPRYLDDNGMLELRVTDKDNMYTHPATCTDLPKEAFEYFEPLGFDWKNDSEHVEGTLEWTPKECLDSIKETPEEPLVMTNSLFNKNCVLRHRTHYIKLTLQDTDTSFRYFFESEDNKHLENSWWLCSHSTKAKIQVQSNFIRKHFSDIIEMHEIIGRLIPKRGYRKIIKNLKTGHLEEIKEGS